jgi:hypothetical protein
VSLMKSQQKRTRKLHRVFPQRRRQPYGSSSACFFLFLVFFVSWSLGGLISSFFFLVFFVSLCLCVLVVAFSFLRHGDAALTHCASQFFEFLTSLVEITFVLEQHGHGLVEDLIGQVVNAQSHQRRCPIQRLADAGGLFQGHVP